MKQDIFKATACEPGKYAIAICERLANGAVGLVTTETVCGLITRAPSGLDKIFALKKRPVTMPVAILITPDHPIVKWAIRDLKFTRIMHEFFPGPLTVVVPRHLIESQLPVDVVHLGYETYGFRSPYYPPIWPIIEAVGGLIFATSANLHGNPAPASIEEVDAEIREGVDFILDGGFCPIGSASNVATLDDDEWHFSRKLPRLPRIAFDMQEQSFADDDTSSDGQSLGINESTDDLCSSITIVVDDHILVITEETPFWTEPPLASLKHAGRVIYKNAGVMTSSQRDMLSALAAWSRVAPIDSHSTVV